MPVTVKEVQQQNGLLCQLKKRDSGNLIITPPEISSLESQTYYCDAVRKMNEVWLDLPYVVIAFFLKCLLAIRLKRFPTRCI